MKYILRIEQAQQQYIQFLGQLQTSGTVTELLLPLWRPGRYELGNFAKNIRCFKVFDEKGKPLIFHKKDKSTWVINHAENQKIQFQYQYYANELNAGSTFLSPDQLYVNPVNCFMYTEHIQDESIEIQLNIPSDYRIATSLQQHEKVLYAENFETLFDSPFIASNTLTHALFEVAGTQFHLWFQGLKEWDEEQLIADFTKFTSQQIERFSEFPVSEYHYLFQIVPYKAYHGVEHLRSTVLLLGPSFAIFKENYKDLLGVCSHELYHTWNVKSIRPIDLFPYRYQTENYSRLGYLCEGITTYMGDKFLFTSGVFNEKAYWDELEAQLQKHFDNPARFNASVAESSFDTWLDGYQPGAPGKKVSIYTEGCLLALLTDIRLLDETNGKYGLQDFMKRLYFDFAVESKGVGEEDFFHVLSQMSGSDWSTWRKDYFYGTHSLEVPLVENLEKIGYQLLHQPSSSPKEAHLGVKTMDHKWGELIVQIYPGSAADMAGLMLEDVIIALNDKMVEQNLNDWMKFYDDGQYRVTIARKGEKLEKVIPVQNRTFFNQYKLGKEEKPNARQKMLYAAWSK